METFLIRPMKADDVDSVIAIEEMAYGPHHWSKESFLGELDNQLAKYYSVLNEKNELVGYAGTWEILEELHITNIAVRLDYRRKHIGELLLQTIINNCYKNLVKYITLEVRIGNKPAIGLYEKYGFKSFGVRKGYYQDNNEDALIMWTENIFYDKFKNVYEKNIADVEGKIKYERQGC